MDLRYDWAWLARRLLLVVVLVLFLLETLGKWHDGGQPGPRLLDSLHLHRARGVVSVIWRVENASSMVKVLWLGDSYGLRSVVPRGVTAAPRHVPTASSFRWNGTLAANRKTSSSRGFVISERKTIENSKRKVKLASAAFANAALQQGRLVTLK